MVRLAIVSGREGPRRNAKGRLFSPSEAVPGPVDGHHDDGTVFSLSAGDVLLVLPTL